MLNPIMAQNSLFELIRQVQTGRVNPRAEVLKAIDGMDAGRKARVKALLPMIERIAGARGLETAQAMQEVSARL